MEPEDLITYCGIYGGTCARWCEYAVFRDLITLLSEWVDASGLRHWMPTEVKEFDYAEFRKALDFFSKHDTWYVCRRCCKGGDGKPDCEIRKCCKDRGLDLCFDCSEFPCRIVQENPKMVGRAKEYRQLGREEWLLQQIEKAQQGFEHHTEKYYQIWANECPLIQSPDTK